MVIKAKTQWDEKYLRESLWMPFGSMCNLTGQALAGKDITPKVLGELATKIFELSLKFTEEAYKRSEKVAEDEIDIPIQ